MNKKRIFIIFFIIFSLISVFEFGYFWGQKKNLCLFLDGWDSLIFQQTYNKLKEVFVNEKEIDDKKLFYGALSGMVSALNDPYTQFFDPQKGKIFLEDATGEFGGIGIEIGFRQGFLTVISALEGTPAQKAGLKAGDVIFKVNGTIVSQLPLDEVVSLIRGEPGTEVTLVILREGEKEPIEFKMKREIIKVPTLKFEILKSAKGNKVIYLKIFEFNDNTFKNFKNIIPLILKENTNKIILDLRGNSGGYLDTAKEIANYFLKNNEVILIEQQREKRKIHLAKNNGLFSDFHIIVLIDRGTASAAEILAAALKENRGAILIGEKTFGKGSVQTLERLSDGSLLKITFAYWLTPKEEKISDIGLSPDIEVKNEEKKDLQLERALEEMDLLKK
jgi:carboxyl-terminal processing protease